MGVLPEIVGGTIVTEDGAILELPIPGHIEEYDEDDVRATAPIPPSAPPARPTK